MTQHTLTKIPALEFIQHDRKMYLFAAKASQLWKLLDVNKKVKDKDEGYQRAFSNNRGAAIQKFIQDGGVIAPSLIVSLEDVIYQDGSLCLSSNSKGWVIDGQHRLRGAEQAAKDDIDIDLAVVAFLDLLEEDQVVQFVTINKEAKGVPTSLYYDLMELHSKKFNNKKPADIAKEKAVEIARFLTKDQNSLFFDRIAFQGTPRKGEISLNNFVRKIYPLLNTNGGLSLYTQMDIVKILNNYFNALKEVFPNEFYKKYTFFNTLGFGAVINAFMDVFLYTTKEYASFQTKDIVNILRRIENFSFDDWSQFGTGSAAEINAGEEISTRLKIEMSLHNTVESKLKL
ncbi:DGQHR domain-containing protein [Wohlfahrtiimonas chitiniclastica]|uniref:DGQHR domain-containing protein n=1 Tax=Wohlfahrtiimonas chitiniclastica TaxID=400946 RepID=UPI001BD0384A|nr:DGQHR domain-containing protein [Wohlfahrtiimonas chitiniclastica]MBS7838030.1 DGQHR domain-containing protein [Wohlfahrtiimonas chitiniclastica]